MRSLDLEEYLWTLGCGEDVVNSMLGHIVAARPFSMMEESVYS